MAEGLLKHFIALMAERDEHGVRRYMPDVDEDTREFFERQGRLEKSRALEERHTDADIAEAIELFRDAEFADVERWFKSLEVFEGYLEWKESKPRNKRLVDRWINECILGRGIHIRSLAAFRGPLSELIREPGFRWGDLNAHIMRLCPAGDLFAAACRGESGKRTGFLSRCFCGLVEKRKSRDEFRGDTCRS